MSRRSAAAGCLALGLALVGPSCQANVAPSGVSVSLPDLSGEQQQPLELAAETRARVLFFVTTDCPIANSYAPEIRAIVEQYSKSGFEFMLVHVDPDLDAEAARKHRDDYALDCCPILLDRAHLLVKELGITITPEVAVVAAADALVYRGRIDDLYAELGKKRFAPRNRDLRACLQAILDGAPIANARTQAVGCDVPFVD